MMYLFQVHSNINLRYGCIGGFVLLENVILYHENLVNNLKKKKFFLKVRYIIFIKIIL